MDTIAATHQARIPCAVPTVLRVGPYRFFFYSSNGLEPRHVHVERDADAAKLWLDPVRIASSGGFSAAEIRRIAGLVRRYRSKLSESWDAYFRG